MTCSTKKMKIPMSSTTNSLNSKTTGDLGVVEEKLTPIELDDEEKVIFGVALRFVSEIWI